MSIRAAFHFHALPVTLIACVYMVSGCDNRKLGDPASQVIGAWNVDVIMASTSSMAYLVDGSVAVNKGDAFGGNADDYPVSGKLGSISTEATSSLLQILLDPESYDWENQKSCIVTPGVRVSFHDSSHLVEIVFCFECDILVVYRDNEFMSTGNFDYAHGALVEWLQREYPKNQMIQELR
jgi:hypothetical protein